MPVYPGETKILSMRNVTTRDKMGKTQNAKEIRLLIRNQSEEVLFIPLSEYTAAKAAVEIDRITAETIALLDRYPSEG